MKIPNISLPDISSGRKTRQGSTFSPYVIKPKHSTFEFECALRDIINYEGDLDYLDNAPIDAGESSEFLSDYDSSPLTTPPSSPASTTPSPPASPRYSLSVPLDPPSACETHVTVGKRRGHAKRSSKKYRKKRRKLMGQTRVAEDFITPPSTYQKHVYPAQPLRTDYSLEHQAGVASTGYVGLRIPQQGRQYWVDELVGPESEFQHTIPLVDNEDRAIILLAGHPDDKDWLRVVQGATSTLESLCQKCKFSEKHQSHRRGEFAALSTGISHGGGQKHPGNLKQNKGNTKVLRQLVNHWAFQRLSGFATGIFRTWAPRLFQYYSEHLESLLKSDPSLKRLFNNSVFAAAAFNFGPRTVCRDHIDFANLPFGWCAIWSLGNYDHTRGGHLVLPDYQVVVEFPPGTLILIPSGVCVHSNTKIRNHETRMSFTQYSAGALFRWVDHGFQTEEMYMATRSRQEACDEEERKRSRWQMGLGLYPTLSDLKIHI